MKNAPGGHQVTVAGYVQMTVKKDVTSSPPHKYIGRAWPETPTSLPDWLIIKITYSGTEFVEVQTVVGSKGYDQIWDNRASLTYQ
jgi:hypothetical protein